MMFGDHARGGCLTDPNPAASGGRTAHHDGLVLYWCAA
jgi:hypothetical protein